MKQNAVLKQAMEDIEAIRDTLILNLISMGDDCQKLKVFGDDRYLKMTDGNLEVADMAIRCSEHFQALVKEGMCLTDAFDHLVRQDYLLEYADAAFSLGEDHE